MRAGWIVAVTAATAVALAAECEPRVTVWLQNSQLGDATLIALAQNTAVRIFAQVGIKLEWRLGTIAKQLPCGENLQVFLDKEAPGNSSPTALAYARIGSHGFAIHVFFRRVVEFHTRQLAPVLLGHVFAHEITHVLENVDRHSDDGLMKANWTVRDYEQMAMRPLRFAPLDVELLRARFELPAGTAVAESAPLL